MGIGSKIAAMATKAATKPKKTKETKSKAKKGLLDILKKDEEPEVTKEKE